MKYHLDCLRIKIAETQNSKYIQTRKHFKPYTKVTTAAPTLILVFL